MKSNTIISLIFSICIFSFCYSASSQQSSVKSELWGELNGKKVELFTLKNKNGMEAKVSNFGGTLISIFAPDRNGIFENVLNGFDNLGDYLKISGQHGKTIGRFANRIGGAQFSLNGTMYKLNPNNGTNFIHGGVNGFSSQVFEVDSVYSDADSAVVSLHYTSVDWTCNKKSDNFLKTMPQD